MLSKTPYITCIGLSMLVVSTWRDFFGYAYILRSTEKWINISVLDHPCPSRGTIHETRTDRENPGTSSDGQLVIAHTSTQIQPPNSQLYISETIAKVYISIPYCLIHYITIFGSLTSPNLKRQCSLTRSKLREHRSRLFLESEIVR